MSLRTRYWEQRAHEIDAQWGTGKEDFPVLSRLIDAIHPTRLLDFGCGSGRLFPLYAAHGVAVVVGQDISERAIAICRTRYPDLGFELTSAPLAVIARESRPFDLIICNRVLQHLSPAEVSSTIPHLVRLGRHIYVNEMTESDHTPQFFFMFLHDYPAEFARLGLEPVETGLIGRQRWYHFAPPALNPVTSNSTPP